MPDVKELLPFIVPLIILEIALLIFSIRHILTHDTYKRGSRVMWLVIVIVGMEFIGPILYFLLGKEDSWRCFRYQRLKNDLAQNRC